jgi:hypothetical protein
MTQADITFFTDDYIDLCRVYIRLQPVQTTRPAASIQLFRTLEVACARKYKINQSAADLIGEGSLRWPRQRASSWMTQRLAWRFADRFMMIS